MLHCARATKEVNKSNTAVWKTVWQWLLIGAYLPVPCRPLTIQQSKWMFLLVISCLFPGFVRNGSVSRAVSARRQLCRGCWGRLKHDCIRLPSSLLLTGCVLDMESGCILIVFSLRRLSLLLSASSGKVVILASLWNISLVWNKHTAGSRVSTLSFSTFEMLEHFLFHVLY